MAINLDQYKSDLKKLISQGVQLNNAIQYNCFPKVFEEECKKELGEKADSFLKNLPSFVDEYQAWYSEAKILIKLLLPDRLADFVRFYERPKTRKEISHESYVIEDFLINLRVTRGYEKTVVVERNSAIPKFQQQLAILSSIKNRFESSLFDIRQLVQADLLDSEMDEAKELLKNKFIRAAGAIAGVVLEHQLKQVCLNHNIKITKNNPSLSELNDILKREDIIDTVQWRNIQYLSDIRNLCDHDKQEDPTHEQVSDLINGTIKITKNLF